MVDQVSRPELCYIKHSIMAFLDFVLNFKMARNGKNICRFIKFGITSIFTALKACEVVLKILPRTTICF